MYEDHLDVMDKSRATASAQPRGYGSVANKKDFKNGKGGSRREPAGPKVREAKGNRAPQQKGRSFDRRPRPREGCSNRKDEEVNNDHIDIDGSQAVRRKKTYNHLLNFSVAGRDSDFHGNGKYDVGTGDRYKRWSGRKSAVKYNKEQFLQANCQFLVKEDDYTVHSVDPDILVDWENIEQIRLFTSDVPCCPICLYPPVAAKITRCGHVYCWRCMLHYLSLSDGKTWRKCPICYEAVHQKDLKSVTPLKTRSYQCGDEIEMSLMKRSKEDVHAMPVSEWTEKNGRPNAWTDDVNLSFSKLIVATPADVQQEIIDAEKTALEAQLADDGESSLEGSFVKAALELLKERQIALDLRKAASESVLKHLEDLTVQDGDEATLTTVEASNDSRDMVKYSCAFSEEEIEPSPDSGMQQSSVMETSPDARVQHPVGNQEMVENAECCEATGDTASASASDSGNHLQSVAAASNDVAMPSHAMSLTRDDGEEVHVSVSEVADELSLPVATETKDATPLKDNALFFYQASDGQQIYMHSLNVRALVHEYGSLQNCPEKISAKIVEIEGITMNEELRGRLRYLNHLPLTCEFKVVELALKPPVISAATLQKFADVIERRRQLRNKKSRDERRKLKKMQECERLKYKDNPEMRVLIKSDYFPEERSTIVKSEMPQLLGAEHTVVGSPGAADVTPVGSSPDAGTSPTDHSAHASLSFAQMLRAGKVKGTAGGWPKLCEDSKMSGKAEAASVDSDDENRAPVFHSSFSDAIKNALDKYDKQPGSDVAVSTSLQVVQSQSGSKKKKAKKTLLFTTNMARTK